MPDTHQQDHFSVISNKADKLATFEESSVIVSFFRRVTNFDQVAFYNLLYLFNGLMMVISVSLNAMSIKHMMLSIKDNGAFFSNVLNFCFNFMFSVPIA